MSETESVESFLEVVVRETWEAFQQDALLYVLAGVVVALLSTVTIGLLAGPLTVGFIELVSRRRRGENARVADVFSGLSKFGSSFVATLLIAIGVLVGCIFLVLPGLLVALFTGFALHAIALESVGPIESLERSFALVRAHFFKVLLLVLAVSVLQSLGGMVVLGLLVTLPMGLVALTVAYQRLLLSSVPQVVVSAPL